MAAGFVQGLSGFALALVATVFWSGTLPPPVFAPLVVICSFCGQMLSIRAVLPSLDLRLAAPLVVGGVVGVPLGVWLLPSIDARMFRLGVGVLLCVYCPAMLGFRSLPQVRWGGRAADAMVGLVGGVMGGIAGLSGPAPTLWCTLRGWPRDVQRAMFQTFLIATQLASLMGYLAAGLVTAEVLHLSAWLLPCALIPSFVGSRLYARLGGDTFRRMVLGLLLATGVLLVVEGVF